MVYCFGHRASRKICLRHIAPTSILLLFWNYLKLREQWSDSFLTTVITLSSEGSVGVVQEWKNEVREESTKDRYCEWMGPVNTSLSPGAMSSCHHLLSSDMQETRFWYFFGDSTMSAMVKGIEKYFFKKEKGCRLDTQKRRQNRCDSLENYLHIPRAQQWIQPNYTLGEGPLYFGFENHFCSDCLGCQSRQHRFRTNDQSQRVRNETVESQTKILEFLPVEFAVDVELQTPNTRTTQETMVLYLRQQHEQHMEESVHTASTYPDYQRLFERVVNMSACVVNTGLHDMAILPQPATGLYTKNVAQYLDQLSEVCGTIVWLMTTSTREDKDRPQRNDLIMEWNVAVNDTLHGNRSNIFRLDPYRFSEIASHADNVHLDMKEYYEPLGELFGVLMTA